MSTKTNRYKWFIEEAKKVVSYHEGRYTERTNADALTSVLLDRDEPMIEAEIRRCFVESGFCFTQEHIDGCRPDSQESVNEQIAYYRE